MTSKVVGVSYDLDGSVPVVVLKGSGAQAEALLQQARRQDDRPVVKDAELLRELYRVPIDTPVGRDLFPVMAALIAHIVSIDRQQRGGIST
jgi:type III secretion system FlhB-like substrate exporter